MGNYNAFKFELDTRDLDKLKPLLSGKDLFKVMDAGMVRRRLAPTCTAGT